MKVILLQLITLLFVNNGCHMQTMQQQDNPHGCTVYINGEIQMLDEQQTHKVDSTVTDLLLHCNDIYEQIVMPDFMNKLRGQDYLELVYDTPQKIQLKQEPLEFTRIFIPLSGKFRQGDDVTFICGNPEYFSPPYVNDKGYPALKLVLDQIKKRE